MDDPRSYSAFQDSTRIASGALSDVALTAKAAIEVSKTARVLVFDDATAEVVDIDFRGSNEDVVRRLGGQAPPSAEESRRGPGRPRLGVVAREVTLLPRHWDWLGRQPGGASVALRKLVEEARRNNSDKDRVRQSQEAAYRFISAMAGDAPGFEEAARALFAGNKARFTELAGGWPPDISDHASRLAALALEGQDAG